MFAHTSFEDLDESFGAGFPRTGTLSTRGALTDLELDRFIHGDSFTDFALLEKITEFYLGTKEIMVPLWIT